eukprot:6741754-Pyramimonas_sp.AAC.1
MLTVWPPLSVAQVVDADSLQETGSHAQDLRTIAPAARRSRAVLIDLGLELSPNKGHIIAASPQLERETIIAPKQYQFNRHRAARQRGRGPSMRRGATGPVQRERVKETSKRIARR